MMADKIQYIEINKLILDSKNPRFADLYTGNSQEEVISYLLTEENAKEIVDSISAKHEFYPDEVLWVLKQDDGNFLVKEGNRRTAAVKALYEPNKFGLNNEKFEIKSLPTLVYTDEAKLNERIREKHATPSFRAWSRIAKALEIHRLSVNGAPDEEIEAIDSKVSEFMKIANFYYEAVKYGDEDFKELVRSGGKKGGKLAVFERLFQSKAKCGYDFKNKKDKYKLIITDANLFKDYIEKIVEYLQENPKTTYYDVDKPELRDLFLEKIGLINNAGNVQLGLDLEVNEQKIQKYDGELPNDVPVVAPAERVQNVVEKNIRGNVKKAPVLTRKGRPRQLDAKIDELFKKLKSDSVPNAKMAMIRIVFECSLKWLLDATEYNQKPLKEFKYFKKAFVTSKGDKREFTDFTELSNLFADLIDEKGIQNAFKMFKPDGLHQIIHNDKVAAVPRDCEVLVNNLIPLIEFLLQDEQELLKKLNTGKLV